MSAQLAVNSTAVRNLADKRHTSQRDAYRAKQVARYDWPRPAMDERIPFRVWIKVELTPDGCWTYRGSKNAQGYGTCLGIDSSRRTSVHRLIWIATQGPVPDGLELDHLCRNRACANPAHLEPVTHRENILRGQTWGAVNAGKTHCKHGHEFTPENTRRVHGDGRACRQCARNSRRRRTMATTDAERAADALRARGYRAMKRAEVSA